MRRLPTFPLKDTYCDGTQRHPIGVSAHNQPVYAPYRPTVRQLSTEIPPASENRR